MKCPISAVMKKDGNDQNLTLGNAEGPVLAFSQILNELFLECGAKKLAELIG
tara:strand:+ start:241 stop:396 length:156 start_codon:yes stop_codon:yes gene_type:complete